MSTLVNLQYERPGDKFDVIIIDPPWQNKAVRRSKSTPLYSTGRCDWLTRLHLGDRLKEGGVVLLWATNNKRVLDLIDDVLLPSWGLQRQATVYWLKVTRGLQPVYSLEDNLHHGNRPFERLLVCTAATNTSTQLCHLDEQLIVSVPCAVPSTKPPLYGMLSSTCSPRVNFNSRLASFCEIIGR